MKLNLDTLRAFAAERTLWVEPDLYEAVSRLGFVQADPIRAPARAQDLILRQRVPGYRAGDLEHCYPELPLEEDAFVNYGFLTREQQRLMHPRQPGFTRVECEHPGLTERIFELIQGQGSVHPRTLAERVGKKPLQNAWGGVSSASTHALEALHYRGLLRVLRREGGIKIYGPAQHLAALEPVDVEAAAQDLVRLVLRVYAPLSEASFRHLVAMLHYGAPHLKPELRVAFKDVLERECRREVVDGVPYVWPDEDPVPTSGDEGELGGELSGAVRLLAPFDPLVWDRKRFEHLYGWAYRFEAYTPAAKRKLGYYALPLLWRTQVIGWANVTWSKASKGLDHAPTLEAEFGFVGVRPRERAFQAALDDEIDRVKTFLDRP